MTIPAVNSQIPAELNATKTAEIINTAAKVEILIEQVKTQRQNNGIADYKKEAQSLNQVARNCNLIEPEQVKSWLAADEKIWTENLRCTWNNKTKTRFCCTYTKFLEFINKTWIAPKYTIVAKLPFIPTEQEIDLLISACGKVTSTVLQMLKETGMRIGELTQLKWTDLDFTRKTVNITPEKGSNPRILPISDKLINMLNTLSRQHSPNVFQPQTRMLREYYSVQRKEIATKLNNPRLRQITFHTLRHWKGTMEYHKVKDIMHVKYVLGHKSINCTLIYINLEETIFLADTDEWISKVSHNLDEETKLVETGFQLVRSVNETTAIYRKRK
jgi:integrase